MEQSRKNPTMLDSEMYMHMHMHWLCLFLWMETYFLIFLKKHNNIIFHNIIIW